MSLYPFNTNMARQAQSDIGPTAPNTLLSPVQAALGSPVVADVDRLAAAEATSNTVTTAVTTFLAQPDVARNITITPGGTTTDVPAGDVTIVGTDIAGNAITDTITFAANASTIGQTSKAFKTVTSVTFPVQDGAGATYDIGVGDKIGLPDKLSLNTVLAAYLAGVREGTAPTVTVSSTVLASNTVDLNSAMNSTAVVVIYFT
jgi:hypothetical protein